MKSRRRAAAAEEEQVVVKDVMMAKDTNAGGMIEQNFDGTFCMTVYDVDFKMARVVKRAGALEADKIERHIFYILQNVKIQNPI